MSYARFGADGSDVYVFLSTNGELECCACALSDGNWVFSSTDRMLQHLRDHQKAGHCVPRYVFEELDRDRAANEPYMAGSPLGNTQEISDPAAEAIANLLLSDAEVRGHLDAEIVRLKTAIVRTIENGQYAHHCRELVNRLIPVLRGAEYE